MWRIAPLPLPAHAVFEKTKPTSEKSFCVIDLENSIAERAAGRMVLAKALTKR
jgi:hypothetical protein